MNGLRARIALIIILPLVFTNCNNGPNPSQAIDKDLPLFTLLDPAESGIDFSNVIEEDENINIVGYNYHYNGGGVAVGDINNDGLPDLFFTGNNVSNKLFLNKGNLKFEDISEAAGIQTGHWSTGATLVDINNDGLLDIYVCNSGPHTDKRLRTNQLFINNGDLTFTDKAEQFGIANTGYSTQASFFDHDKDGDLDLFVMNHALMEFKGHQAWLYHMNQMPVNEKKEQCGNLYRNNGNNTFTDISEEAGLLYPTFGLGLITADLNHDGWVDIYIANDFFVPDYMFINQQNGTFLDDINTRTNHISYFSMGVDAADFNNDGLVDIGVVDMTPDDHVRNKMLMASMNVQDFYTFADKYKFQKQFMFNTLQVNTGFGYYSDIGLAAGIAKTDWSWAALFADFDNDGLKDFLVTNGFRRDVRNNDWHRQLVTIFASDDKENRKKNIFEHLKKADSKPVTNYIYKNNGNYTFTDNSSKWGFNDPSFSNGAVYADLDLDGDLDIVINNIDKTAFVFKNNAERIGNNNFIRFKILDKNSKNPVYNTKISIYHGDEMQYIELHPVRGYQSSVEDAAHFGLGAATSVDSVKIEWPNGTQSVLTGLKINKTHTISQKDLPTRPVASDASKTPFFNLTNRLLTTIFAHKENDFDDFEKEVLLPHRQSMLGPFVAVGDVNGDRLEDFFVGGAHGQAGQLYLQNPSGQFDPSPSQPWNNDAQYEDMGALLFDADGDGDLDLYVASGGGGEFSNSPHLLQDRLYINDGKGNFKRDVNALPKMQVSSGRVKSIDFDGDGDFDLFIAGRTTPGKYPHPTDSYLLRNDKGKFTDVTDEIAPGLRKLGMVTDAVFTDFDKDGRIDLFVVGEWMPVTCFKNEGGKFTNYTKQLGLDDKTGWWSSITAADIDNDGDMDFIAGNIGINNKFNPSKEKPLYVYCNDFDNNGSLDIVLSKDYKGNQVPVRGKECSTAQMPFLSEKFPTYQSFASSSLSEIYGDDKLQEALFYSANYFQSVFIENKGNGKFEFHPLPVEAQLAPINAIIARDFNNDGNIDLVIGGNYFQTEVETPQYDAGKGLLLKGNGDGTFETSILLKNSGLTLLFDVKDLALISIQNRLPAILVTNNNNTIQLFGYDQNTAF